MRPEGDQGQCQNVVIGRRGRQEGHLLPDRRREQEGPPGPRHLHRHEGRPGQGQGHRRRRGEGRQEGPDRRPRSRRPSDARPPSPSASIASRRRRATPSPAGSASPGVPIGRRSPTSRDLLILGASARAAAFSALRAGFAPVGADLFADRDLAAVCPCSRVDPRRLSRRPRRRGRGVARRPLDLHRGAREPPRPGRPDRPAPPALGQRRRDRCAPSATRSRSPTALRAPGFPRPRSGSTRRACPATAPGWSSRSPRPAGRGSSRCGPAIGGRRRRPCYYQERIDGPSLSAVFVGDARRARARRGDPAVDRPARARRSPTGEPRPLAGRGPRAAPDRGARARRWRRRSASSACSAST